MNITKFITNKKIFLISATGFVLLTAAGYKISIHSFNRKNNISQSINIQNGSKLNQNDSEVTLNLNSNESVDQNNIENATKSSPKITATLASDIVVKTNKYGNTPSNINAMGFIALQDNWIYYNALNGNTGRMGNGGLYRSMLDGSTGLQKLSDDNAAFINVVGPWIYYKVIETPGIWKIKINGKEKTRLSNDDATFINVIDDWIYYLDSSNSILYKMKTDGTLRSEISNALSYTFSNDREYIYYSSPSGGLYKIQIDSTKSTKLSDDVFYNIISDGEWIYGNISNNTLLCVKDDGSNQRILNFNSNTPIAIYDGFLYYFIESTSGSSNFSRRFTLSKNTIPNSRLKPEKLETYSFSNPIYIFNDTIYFVGNRPYVGNSSFSLYSIKINGKDSYLSTPQVGSRNPDLY